MVGAMASSGVVLQVPRILLPSKQVALVKNGQNRSASLPTKCDSCNRAICLYPFVAKHGSGYRKYHVGCALRIGVVVALEL